MKARSTVRYPQPIREALRAAFPTTRFWISRDGVIAPFFSIGWANSGPTPDEVEEALVDAKVAEISDSCGRYGGLEIGDFPICTYQFDPNLRERS